jgi:ubiquinone/menaquinone biosynthesis C-methylase UbiE
VAQVTRNSDAPPIPIGARVDLGCGPRKLSDGHVGVDIHAYPGVDVVGDALTLLRSQPDASLREVYSAHFFEHLDNPEEMLTEIARVLEPGGRLQIVVPHFSNAYHYSDLTHRRFWGLYSLSYIVRSVPFRREVPRYDDPLPFVMEDARLVFKAARPFYIRYAVRRLVGLVVNCHRGMQEFYEDQLAWIFPCYELSFVLRRD